MCGIAGALDLRANRMFPRERLDQMCDALRHRGPDDRDRHMEPGIALAAVRLSIVDLMGGRQPMSNEDGSIWGAFNGELFEYPDIRQTLLKSGHQLRTRCDSEVWTHLYEDHRDDLFSHVRGQFAVSLWDSNTRRLLLGRDRFGILPLYYAEADGWLLWSSEVKGLLASGLIEATPDDAALDHFLTFLYSSSQQKSFLRGIHQLPPAHVLRAENGSCSVRRYWDLSYPQKGAEVRVKDPRELVEELDQRLQTSIRRRLHGDVPVVCYLSGGVDSTLVTAMAAKVSGEPRPAFTVGLDQAGKDERSLAQQSADYLGVPLTVVNMRRKDIAEAYPELVMAAEAPVVDTTSACMIRLAQRVHAAGFKVALSGEGADELFGGYQWNWGLSWRWPARRLFHLLNPGRKPIEWITENGTFDQVPFHGFLNQRPVQQSVMEHLSRFRVSLYSPEMWERLRGCNPMAELALFPQEFAGWDPLHQAGYIDYRTFLQGHLLSSKGDRPAMNASLETRPPFLDEDVVAFGTQLAPEYKIRGRMEKWLLREVAKRYLPAEIANRRKHGFHATFARSFLGADRPVWVDQVLSQDSLIKGGVFNPEAVLKLRRLLETTSRHSRMLADMSLASVISTQLWLHIYCNRALCELPTWASRGMKPSAAA